MRDALISIHPEHVKSILGGGKTVEVRRRRIRIPPGSRLWIYSTLPSGKVEAVATVVATEAGSPEEIWRKVGAVSGTSFDRFEAYSRGRAEIHILWLSNVRKLREAPSLEELRSEIPGFMPPQSFMWIPKPLLDFLRPRLD